MPLEKGIELLHDNGIQYFLRKGSKNNQNFAEINPNIEKKQTRKQTGVKKAITSDIFRNHLKKISHIILAKKKKKLE